MACPENVALLKANVSVWLSAGLRKVASQCGWPMWLLAYCHLVTKCGWLNVCLSLTMSKAGQPQPMASQPVCGWLSWQSVAVAKPANGNVIKANGNVLALSSQPVWLM